jgi:hypothetical protein
LQGPVDTALAGNIAKEVTGGFDAETFDPETFDTEISEDGQQVEAVAARIASNLQLFEHYAASAIRKELEQLEARIPNEPGALEGYERVRDMLRSLEVGFVSLAEIVHESKELEGPSEKVNLLTKAVHAAERMSNGFVSWLNENGNKAGRVMAELGLSGIIAGTLSYYVGVPPMISFPITIAALNGKSVWDAIVLFAPNKPRKE